MSPRATVRLCALLLLAAFAAACGDSGDETGPTQPTERVSSISVSPDSVRLPVEDTSTLEATVRGPDGNVVQDVDVDWSSRDPQVAEVDATGQVRALALRPTVVYAVAEDDTGRATVVGAPAMAENAVSVDSTTLTLISEQADRDEGIYKFRVQGDTSVSFEQGQVIVGAQGPGFLRKVTSQSKSGDVITLETEQARLTEALKAGELHIDMSLEPGAQQRTISGVRADYGPNVVAGRRVHLGRTRVAYVAEGVTIGNNGAIQFSHEFGKQNFKLNFKGSVAFTPRTRASLAWNKAGPVSGVDSMRVSVGGTAKLTAEAKATAEAQVGMEKEARLAGFSRNFTAPVGPVVIQGRVIMDVMLGLRASAGAQATLTTGQAELTQDAVVTARYKNGSFSFPTDFSTDFQPPTPDFESSAKAKARPYVRTDVAVVLYEVVGPAIGPEPYLEGIGEVHLDGPNHCETHAGIYGGLDVRTALAWGKAGKKVKNLLDIPDVEKQLQGPRAEIAARTWYCTGKLQVDNETTGEGTDPDGYVVEVGDSISEGVGLGESLILPDVKTGDREVRLTDLASQCAVEGDNPRTVTVKRNEASHTEFSVTCAAQGSDLQVSASTSGVDQDSDGYTVAVDDSLTKEIDPNGSATFDSLSDGSHQVELTGVANNCSVQGDNPRSVSITAGDLTTTSYDVSCERSLPGRIVFHSARDDDVYYELYEMNADGTDVDRLTNNDQVSDDGPAVSPDGEWIAYARGDELYKMKPDGSDKTQLTDVLESDWGPSWSPDGSQLAFLSYRTSNNELYTMNADGTGITQLTDGGAQEYSASWSADGDRIAFTSEYRDDGLGDIYLIDPEGSNMESVTDENMTASNIEWSPDGERIVFSSRGLDDSGNNDIYIINADGTGLTRVTDHEHGDNFPTWSPSGEKIAFTSSRDGDREIYVINTDGTGLIQVTDNAVLDSDPSWGPKPE